MRYFRIRGFIVRVVGKKGSCLQPPASAEGKSQTDQEKEQEGNSYERGERESMVAGDQRAGMREKVREQVRAR